MSSLAVEEAPASHAKKYILKQEYPSTGRITSIDVLRGLTILTMIFVNDLAGVRGVPGWMKHVEPPTADGMTFVDIVFPAFLFIVGMSIPFALGKRLQRTGSILKVWGHILVRTAGLLIIGVLMVNTENIVDSGILGSTLWILLMYIAVSMVWGSPSKETGFNPGIQTAVRVVGAALLVILAFLYRGEGMSGFFQIRHYWWGILGLIGWSYLVSCSLYIIFRKSLPGLIGMMCILYSAYVAGAAGLFSSINLVNVGSAIGSHGALTVSGMILGVMLLPDSKLASHSARMRWAVLFGIVMAVTAFLLHEAHPIHRMFIINKNAATPPWCLWSAAITTWIWVGIYWLLDVKGWRRGSRLLELAGQNALLAYILAPIAYAIIRLFFDTTGLTNAWSWLGSSFSTGFWRSVVFAFVVTGLAALLKKKGFALKL